MPIDPALTRYYRRARFTTRLPTHYRYAPSHYWLQETEPGVFRVGLTHFATRMLGEFVERDFTVAPDDKVDLGQSIGWIEGFKAVSDVYCVANGIFVGSNQSLDQQPELVERDPYDRGWLYQIRGELDESCLDCDSYVALLDTTIDRILDQEKSQKGSC